MKNLLKETICDLAEKLGMMLLAFVVAISKSQKRSLKNLQTESTTTDMVVQRLHKTL